MDDFESLRICPECDCRLCFESATEPLTPQLWLVVVQCPNCWHAWRRTVSDVELELFERALDDDTRVIEQAVDGLALENAKELAREAHLFKLALDADAIFPMDF